VGTIVRRNQVIALTFVVLISLFYLLFLPSTIQPEKEKILQEGEDKPKAVQNVNIEIKGDTYYFESKTELKEDTGVPTWITLIRNRTSLDYSFKSNFAPNMSENVVYPGFREGTEVNQDGSVIIDPAFDTFDEKGEWYSQSYNVPNKVNCVVSFLGFSRDIKTELTFPFQECSVNSDIGTNGVDKVVNTRVVYPDNFDLRTEYSFVACPAKFQDVDEKVGLLNDNKKIAVFEQVRSTGSGGQCIVQLSFTPNNLYKFIFVVALLSSILSYSYFRETGELPKALGTMIAIWTFQEALIPLNGLERPLTLTLFDLTVFLGAGIAELNYRTGLFDVEDFRKIGRYIGKVSDFF